MDQLILPQNTSGPVLVCDEGLSFWGGVDAQTSVIQDAHHPQHGASLAGALVMMPTSRGSCSGSGVLLELALNGHAPAALIFHEQEDILTLGAFISARMYDRPVAVLRLSKKSYGLLAQHPDAKIDGKQLCAGNMCLPLEPLNLSGMNLSAKDMEKLNGAEGPAVKLAMDAICTMGSIQSAARLIDVTRAHIDGCIYAGPANLTFAQTMKDMSAKVAIPTTMNAISVDLDNWQAQGVPHLFGTPASRLAEAYVDMGASPTFSCAPYLANDRPKQGEDIGWSESNAVIYANSVLGARTVKHPDFLDLFIALTGRAPLSGVYLEENRQAQIRIDIDVPKHHDDALWPLIGWVVGQHAPDRIPMIEGLETFAPNEDDLKALCAAFGTTSAAPMLHISGITPEGHKAACKGAPVVKLGKKDLAQAWEKLNAGAEKIDLVALGSPHFSLGETRAFANTMRGKTCHANTPTIITLGRDTFEGVQAEGLLEVLESAGVKIVKDLCWCSISEPVFPPAARNLITNSGKYAHYGPGLSGRSVRFGSLADCAKAAIDGQLDKTLPHWLQG